METRYDEQRNIVVIGKPLEVSLSKEGYEIVQKLTGKKFGEFYKPDNSGRIVIVNGKTTGLVLSELELIILDSSIGKLSSLQELYVGENQLTSLPESIGKLSSLQELYVGENRFDKKTRELLKELKKNIEIFD